MTATVDLTHHGDDELAPGLLDLAVNVYPGPMPTWLSTAVLSACGRLDSYPDPGAATAAVAGRHGRAASEVLLTAGAAEAFSLVAQGLRDHRPAKAAVVHPQFTEPELALRAAGWDVHRVMLPVGAQLDPGEVPDDCTLVVLGNPTNPTGVLHRRYAVQALRRPGRVVVVDEAFMDAVPGEPESLAAEPDLAGLLVVRSLTKTWGLAGLRIGYLLGDRAAIAACAAAQPRWAVSSPAAAAAQVCMTPGALDEAGRRAKELSSAREELRAELTARGFELVTGSVGPFLLARHPDRPGLHGELRRAGIAVRRADTFPGLGAGWVRISVRDIATTARLMTALDSRGERAAGRAGGGVTLVGGGPGGPGQITVDGLLALQRADVVITDRLAPLELLDGLGEHVTIIDAAKNPRGKAMPQQRINELLIENAVAGHEVVRLKGGDGFVFGRGFEEVEACSAAGIRVTVIPGLTSAVAAPAAIGVPVTHRGLTHGFSVVSGHLPPDHPDCLVDWSALARSGTTLILLMAVATLPAIAERLVAEGMAADLPVAVVQDAGRPTQREIRSTLAETASGGLAADIEPPAITVIGRVAGLIEPAGPSA